MLDVVVDLSHEIWVTMLNISSWLLSGKWYEILFGLLGITGALFTVQQIHLKLRRASPILSFLTMLALIIATLFWFLLIAAVIRNAFFFS